MSIGKRLAAVLLLLSAFVRLSSASTAADRRALYDPLVRELSAKHRVDPDLVHLIIRAESNYENFAVSHKGAMGLMQLMAGTANQYGVKNVFDAAQNIEGGIKYLKDLIKLFDGETRLVLAAYNAGQEAVRRYNGIPPFPETRAYINTIMKNYGKTTVRTTNRVYRFVDESGRVVLTTDPNLLSRIKDD
jgi:soluble lytic murein transglycosylase-like protein